MPYFQELRKLREYLSETIKTIASKVISTEGLDMLSFHSTIEVLSDTQFLPAPHTQSDVNKLEQNPCINQEYDGIINQEQRRFVKIVADDVCGFKIHYECQKPTVSEFCLWLLQILLMLGSAVLFSAILYFIIIAVNCSRNLIKYICQAFMLLGLVICCRTSKNRAEVIILGLMILFTMGIHRCNDVLQFKFTAQLSYPPIAVAQMHLIGLRSPLPLHLPRERQRKDSLERSSLHQERIITARKDRRIYAVH